MGTGIVKGMHLAVEIEEGNAAVLQIDAEAGTRREVLDFFDRDKLWIHVIGFEEGSRIFSHQKSNYTNPAKEVTTASFDSLDSLESSMI